MLPSCHCLFYLGHLPSGFRSDPRSDLAAELARRFAMSAQSPCRVTVWFLVLTDLWQIHFQTQRQQKTTRTHCRSAAMTRKYQYQSQYPRTCCSGVVQWLSGRSDSVHLPKSQKTAPKTTQVWNCLTHNPKTTGNVYAKNRETGIIYNVGTTLTSRKKVETIRELSKVCLSDFAGLKQHRVDSMWGRCGRRRRRYSLVRGGAKVLHGDQVVSVCCSRCVRKEKWKRTVKDMSK